MLQHKVWEKELVTQHIYSSSQTGPNFIKILLYLWEQIRAAGARRGSTSRSQRLPWNSLSNYSQEAPLKHLQGGAVQGELVQNIPAPLWAIALPFHALRESFAFCSLFCQPPAVPSPPCGTTQGRRSPRKGRDTEKSLEGQDKQWPWAHVAPLCRFPRSNNGSVSHQKLIFLNLFLSLLPIFTKHLGISHLWALQPSFQICLKTNRF